MNKGLFAVPLSPTGVNWEVFTPYIEVTVGNQLLLPREPLTATVYVTISGSVVDGAISLSKLSAPVQSFLVPSGMIAMFDTAYPAGWTRFSALDNKFPRGDSVPGLAGGSATTTHNHGILMESAHIHRLGTGGQSNYNCNGLPIGGAQGAQLFYSGTTSGSCTMYIASPQTTASGQHNHGGVTVDASVSIVPPYLSILWCKKN